MPQADLGFDINKTFDTAVTRTKILRHLPEGLLTNLKAGIHEATIYSDVNEYDYPRTEITTKDAKYIMVDDSSFSKVIHKLFTVDDNAKASNGENYEKIVKKNINSFVIALDKALVKSTEFTNDITGGAPTPPNPYLDTTTLEDILIYLSENMIGADLIVLAGTYEKLFLEDPAARNAILTDSINWHGAPMVFARDTEQTAFISGIVYGDSTVGVAEDTIPSIYTDRVLMNNSYITEIANTLVTNWQGYRGLLPTGYAVYWPVDEKGNDLLGIGFRDSSGVLEYTDKKGIPNINDLNSWIKGISGKSKAYNPTIGYVVGKSTVGLTPTYDTFKYADTMSGDYGKSGLYFGGIDGSPIAGLMKNDWDNYMSESTVNGVVSQNSLTVGTITIPNKYIVDVTIDYVDENNNILYKFNYKTPKKSIYNDNRNDVQYRYASLAYDSSLLVTDGYFERDNDFYIKANMSFIPELYDIIHGKYTLSKTGIESGVGTDLSNNIVKIQMHFTKLPDLSKATATPKTTA